MLLDISYFDICSSRNITIYSLVSDYRACSNETKKKKIRVDNTQCGFHVLLITIMFPRESFFGKISMLPVYFCKTSFFPNAFFFTSSSISCFLLSSSIFHAKMDLLLVGTSGEVLLCCIHLVFRILQQQKSIQEI